VATVVKVKHENRHAIADHQRQHLRAVIHVTGNKKFIQRSVCHFSFPFPLFSPFFVVVVDRNFSISAAAAAVVRE
jgi:hypothetical protein